LSIGDNKFGEVGGRRVADMLMKNTCLTKIAIGERDDLEQIKSVSLLRRQY